jgi:hypothetical protein
MTELFLFFEEEAEELFASMGEVQCGSGRRDRTT